MGISVVVRNVLTNLSLWLIRKINRYKDRCLSQRLFDLAEGYNTRPGTNDYCRKGREESE